MIQALLQLGLNEKEAKVYLLLLKVGASPASVLAKRLQMKRATIYSTLQSLEEKALVSFLNEQGCRRYLPHDPERLLYELEEQEIRLRSQIKDAKAFVSHLSVWKPNFSERSHFALFKGQDSVSKITQEFQGSTPVQILAKTEKLPQLRERFPFARIKTLPKASLFSHLLLQKNALLLVLESQELHALHLKSSPYVEVLTELLMNAYS